MKGIVLAGISLWFLPYLWGIERKFLKKTWQKMQKVFTLPMRNWKSLAKLIGLNEAISFYPTYEELKGK